MFMLGVVLTALAVLFLLTTMALWASDELRHPLRTTAALTALLATGLALLFG